MKTLTKYYEDLVLNPEPNCFCMLKPGFAEYKDEFEKLLNLQGWKIIARCIKKFTRDEIEDFYIMHKDKPFYHKLCDYMITDDCVCYTCYKNCQDPFKDMDSFKKKIRDEWGEDEMKNGMHSSDCKENMKKECLIAFNSVNEKLKISNHKGLSPKDTVYVCNCLYKLFEQEADWSYEDIDSYFDEIKKHSSIFIALSEMELLDEFVSEFYNFETKENRFHFEGEVDTEEFLKNNDKELTEYFIEIYI
jgi:nucleoside-diphosphate kinase